MSSTHTLIIVMTELICWTIVEACFWTKFNLDKNRKHSNSFCIGFEFDHSHICLFVLAADILKKKFNMWTQSRFGHSNDTIALHENAVSRIFVDLVLNTLPTFCGY